MNFLNRTLVCEDLRDCTLITKNGTKITATIDSIESSIDTLPKFEGRIMGVQTSEPKLSYDGYCRKDFELQRSIYRNMLNSMYGIRTAEKNYIPEIKNVIFNDPATIVFWEDGTKTVVKCQDGDEFDPEKGLAMAIVKKAYGNKGSYCNKLKKWLPKEEQVDTNPILRGISEPKVFPVTIDIDKLSKSFNKGISDALDIIFKGTKCTSNDNNVPSKKRMTFREEVAKLHPERIDSIFQGGVCGCPRDMDTCPYSTNMSHCPSENDCRACWDREIPDELMDND